MGVPGNFVSLTHIAMTRVLPTVNRFLGGWKEKANKIPDPELRRQALMSIEAKTFHCEGGGIYTLLAGEHAHETMRFIIAYQTISDYLDNLCDRGTSRDPEDFRTLHTALADALTPGAEPGDYYRCREEKDDGGYLPALVRTCQNVLKDHRAYDRIAPSLMELAGYYRELQVHKHVRAEEVRPRLESWFAGYRDRFPDMQWQEFAAASGSTLGVFSLVSQSWDNDLSDDVIGRMKEAYFPWVQGLHILLDYYVDREEDHLAGELNFCDQYRSESEMGARFIQFYRVSDQALGDLPNPRFQRMLLRGVLAVYLSDVKVGRQDRGVKKLARRLLREGGPLAWFFFVNCWVYRRLMNS
jgi:tetraprenyl-beta-curcumene synthase